MTNPEPVAFQRSVAKVIAQYFATLPMLVGGPCLAAYGFALAASGFGLHIPFVRVIWFGIAVSIILFCFGTFACAITLFPQTQINLSREGFGYRTRLKENTWQWDQVQGFQVKRVLLTQFVIFDFRPKNALKARRCMIPTFFDIKPADLVKLLEEFRRSNDA
jgi:hypothetical protein